MISEVAPRRRRGFFASLPFVGIQLLRMGENGNSSIFRQSLPCQRFYVVSLGNVTLVWIVMVVGIRKDPGKEIPCRGLRLPPEEHLPSVEVDRVHEMGEFTAVEVGPQIAAEALCYETILGGTER